MSFYNFGIACFVSLIARLLTHPLDTIKARPNREQSIVRLIRDLIQWQGLRGLYTGLPATLLFSVPALGLYLSSYDAVCLIPALNDKTKEFLGFYFNLSSESTLTFVIAGGIAEMLSGLLWTPMEVIKTRQQAELFESQVDLEEDEEELVPENGSFGDIVRASAMTASSMADISSHIWQREGSIGFFRGYWLGLAVYVPHSMIYFTTYENLKTFGRAYGLDHYGFLYFAICSGIAGAIAAYISNIADVIKTRWQMRSHESRQNLWLLIKDMWIREGGLKAFFQGSQARILWAIPNIVISFTLYEIIKIGNA